MSNIYFGVTALAMFSSLLSVISIVLVFSGGMLVRRFCTQTTPETYDLPGVTVLKPLCGDEPLLEPALASTCAQDALLARALGHQDALGATMALWRQTLAAVGGFTALRNHLADDNVLGRKVRQQGLAIGLAATVPATTVPETRPAALFRHELRWARTIRSLSPLAFAASALQYPLAWTLLVLSASAGWAVLLLLTAAAWMVRGGVARRIDRSLGLVAQGRAAPVPLWLLPLRDLMLMAVLLASYAGNQVEWRGRMMRTERSRARNGRRWMPKHRTVAPGRGIGALGR